MTTYYKFLNPDGSPCNGGGGVWRLPADGRPGDWMPPISGLVPCQRGYHVCRKQDLLQWCGPTLWTAEIRGHYIEAGSKIVAEQARLLQLLPGWNDRTARLFACDCAERALRATKSTDPRSWKALAISRRFAFAEVPKDELKTAADAAWAAARAKRWVAAAVFAAAWVAAAAAAFAAALPVAWVAAAFAAMDAARAAAAKAAEAKAAERSWQLDRFFEYVQGRVDITKAPATEIPAASGRRRRTNCGSMRRD